MSTLKWRQEHISLDNISENIVNNVFLWNVLQLNFYKFVAEILKVAVAFLLAALQVLPIFGENNLVTFYLW